MFVALTIAGFALRLALIFVRPDGGSDLQIYHYFGNLVVQGQNPYQAPLDGAINPGYADMPPFNLGLFACVLSVVNSPIALRVFFAVVDFLVLSLLATWPNQTPSWRLHRVLFYGFNPLVLLSLVVVAEDKVIVIALLFAALAFAERGRSLAALAATSLLAIYKWMGVLFVVPLACNLAKTKRQALVFLGGFALLLVASHIPYFPSNLVAYEYREARTLGQPIHASITQFLSLAGLYHPLIVKVGLVATLISTHALFLLRKLDLKETVVASTFFSYILAPEIGAERIVMITLPFLLIVELSSRRLLILWALTSVAAVALAFQYAGMSGATGNIHTMGAVLFGSYGSLRHVLYMHLFPGAMLIYWFIDRRRRTCERLRRSSSGT